MKYTKEQIDQTHLFLNARAEDDSDFVELRHEFEVVRSIVENKSDPVEWLESLVEQFLDYIK
jgi:DNA-dependent RNA polymerase auxiliary subunit epsilon